MRNIYNSTVSVCVSVCTLLNPFSQAAKINDSGLDSPFLLRSLMRKFMLDQNYSYCHKNHSSSHSFNNICVISLNFCQISYTIFCVFYLMNYVLYSRTRHNQTHFKVCLVWKRYNLFDRKKYNIMLIIELFISLLEISLNSQHFH